MPEVDGQRFPYTKQGKADAAVARRRGAGDPSHRPDLERTPRRRPQVASPPDLTHAPLGPAAAPQEAQSQTDMKEFFDWIRAAASRHPTQRRTPTPQGSPAFQGSPATPGTSSVGRRPFPQQRGRVPPRIPGA